MVQGVAALKVAAPKVVVPKMAAPKVAVPPNVIDTKVHPTETPCAQASKSEGCLNGYTFNYAWQMPCGNFIVNMGTHGCCPIRGPEVVAYEIDNESCCEVGTDGNHEVRQGGHFCNCRKRDCQRSDVVTV